MPTPLVKAAHSIHALLRSGKGEDHRYRRFEPIDYYQQLDSNGWPKTAIPLVNTAQLSYGHKW